MKALREDSQIDFAGRSNRGGGGAGRHVPSTFLEIAVVTLEKNAAQKNFFAMPPPIQFPSYGTVL